MSNYHQTFLGWTFPILALDAVQDVYGYVGLGFEQVRVHDVFKSILVEARFVHNGPLVYEAFFRVPMPAHIKEELLRWMDDAYVSLEGDRTLADWLGIFHMLLYRQLRVEDMTGEQSALLAATAASYRNATRNDGYLEVVDEIKSRSELSEWDMKLHTTYGFNYFDDMQGKDPFLHTKFTRKGRILLDFIRQSPLLQEPVFPIAQLKAAGRRQFVEDGALHPRDREIADLMSLQGRRSHD